MGISRLSRQVQPAKFNPLTADQIMKVPMLKTQIENEQIGKIEDARLAMMNADVGEGDLEKVREEQGRLNKEFDSLVGDITTKGVGYRTTEKVTDFMRDYSQSTSRSGIIGGAAEYNKKRTEGMKEAKAQAIRLGYDMSRFNEYARNNDLTQSAFDEEGQLTRADYEGLYLPNQLRPEEMLEEEIKAGIGNFKRRDAEGNITGWNMPQLLQAKQLIMDRFASDPSYQKLMELSGLDMNAIDKILSKKIDVLEQGTTTAALPKVAKDTSAADAKAKIAEDEESARYAEDVISGSGSSISPTSNVFTEKGVEAAKAAYEEEPTSASVRKNYALAKEGSKKIEKAYDATSSGIMQKRNIAGTYAALQNQEPLKESTSKEEIVKYVKAKNDQNSMAPEVYTTFTTHGYFYDKDSGTYKAYDSSNDVYTDWEDSVSNYEEGLATFKEGDNNPLVTSAYSISPASLYTENTKALKKWEEVSKQAITTGQSFYDIRTLSHITAKGEIEDEMVMGVTSLQDDEFEEKSTLIKKQLQSGTATINSVELIPGGDYANPRMKVSFNLKEDAGKEAKGSYSMIVEMKDMKESPGALTGVPADSAIAKTFSSALPDTADAVDFRKSFNKWKKYGMIIAETGDPEYIQSPDIKAKVQGGTISKHMIGKGDKVAVVSVNTAYGPQFQMQKRNSAGVLNFIDEGDVLAAYGIDNKLDLSSEEGANKLQQALVNITATNPALREYIRVAFGEGREAGKTNETVIKELINSVDTISLNSKEGLLDMISAK